MVDDIGFQPLPKDDGVGFQAIPNPPDTSGVQKMAQDNLAANDNKEISAEPKSPQTPKERLNIAVGQPVANLLNPDDNTPINPPLRKAYTKMLQNGDANNFGDALQTILHTVVPIAHGISNPIDTTKKYAKNVAESAIAGMKATPAAVAGMISPEVHQELVEAGDLESPITIAKIGAPTGPEMINAATQGERSSLGTGASALFWPVASLLGPAINPLIEKTGGNPQKQGEPLTYRQTIPGVIGSTMDIFGMGALGGAHEVTRPLGPWDNLPGKSVLAEHVAKAVNKPVDQISSADFDQAIAQGVNHKAPAAQDFKTVDNFTNGVLNEKTLHVVFNETGVKPEQVFTDARTDPSIAVDISAGKIPEQYEHLIEEKSPLTPDKVEPLHIVRDEVTRSFTVTDEEGDHVSGGFDSAEEARNFIEDEKFKAEEREAIEKEGEEKPQDVFTHESVKEIEQEKPVENIYSGIEEKIGSMTQEERDLRLQFLNKKMEAGIITPKELGEREALADKAQAIKNTTIGNFAQKPKIIPPSETGKVTSLRSFLSNNGAKFNEANELISIKKNGEIIKGKSAQEYAHEIAKENGYLPKDEANKPSRSVKDLQDSLAEKGGKEHFRNQDANRVAKAKEALETRKNFDPDKIEQEAYSAGLDTELVKGETTKQRTTRLIKALQEFYKAQEGSGASDAMRKAIGSVITTAENFVGKLSGGLFEKLGESYIRTFQPELNGPLAKRADAFLAKYKARGQEAEHVQYMLSKQQIRKWDRKTSDEKMEWLNDHDTGRWNEDDDPDHARFQALFDATYKAETNAIGSDAEIGYKDNYLPHAWENPDEVKKYFNSDAYIKKYGKDGFTKRSEFQLVQDGIRAGFKLKTDNPERMLVARLLAGQDMIRVMDLLKDLEDSGIAKKATAFSIEKRIAKTEKSIAELQDKYKKEIEDIKNPKQTTAEGVAPPTPSKKMQMVMKRLDALNTRLDDFNKEKAENKLTPEQMKELKGGFRVIGPDSKVWNIHQEVGPLWKNAMEMKGLWERDGAIGDSYRSYMQGKAIWTQVKLGISLFHPLHVAMIDLASDIASATHNLIQGGNLSSIATKENIPNLGLTKNTFRGQDHPAIKAWNTDAKLKTPEQHQMVERIKEGGLNPIMSARDTIHFRENFDKAIKGIGLNNLRLISTAASLPGMIMKPFFEHWIPGMKAEIYLRRYQDAIDRDPSLANDYGRRGEIARQIAKDTDRTYGEMNNDVQFWNKNLRDSFNAAFISGGWKLAQIYNVRGLIQPLKIIHDFAKTGEFSKESITFNMLHAYAYTGLTLALGGAINTILGNPIGTTKDTVWDMIKNLVAPQTGEKNPDGTPIRLNQPAFAKEAYNLAHEINTKGLLAGSGAFLYHQTLLPGIADTLMNRDFVGREEISDPTDLNQWMNAGWQAINPIAMGNAEKAEMKGSKIGKIAGYIGFPLAGSYLNQTPFEQKVIAKFDEQNPPKGDAYQAKLKTDLKSAIAKKDTESEQRIEKMMKEEGMTSHQIESAKKTFTQPFAEHAWKELPVSDQKRLIESASDEEKKKFKVKGQ